MFEQYSLNYNHIYSGEYLPEGTETELLTNNKIVIEFPLLYYKEYKFTG